MDNVEDIYSDALKKVKIPENFTTETLDFSDVYTIMYNELKETKLWKSLPDMNKFFFELRRGDDHAVITAVVTVICSILFAYYYLSYLFQKAPEIESEKKEEEREPPRDFTVNQLRDYDGTGDKPIYIGLGRDVYDVSSARDFYGEGCGYHCFAGREASRAMAKLSFDEEDLSNMNINDLGPFERSTLNDWIEKFKHYKCYPIVGKVSVAPPQKEFRREELFNFKGLQEVPEGRIDAPIYLGINGKVIDVSYGGKEMYAEGGPYHIFAGIDASRALAKMSFDAECLNNYDISDLTESERKVLADWEKKFIAIKKYPVVGTIV